jgi:hypothetical protein
MTEIIFTVEIKDKKLHVIYNKQRYGLHSFFSSEERVERYILNHLEDALLEAVSLQEDGSYCINIASVENFGAFEWKCAGDILHRQLSIYMPIIQKFVEDVVTEKI